MQSVLTKKQTKKLIAHNVMVDGEIYKKVEAVIRYDDQCGNGHNSFAITGSFYMNQREVNKDDPSMCGCCHDDLIKVFPELKPFIKWHFMSSDKPMHYVANTLHHARDTDVKGKKVGEPTKFKSCLKFNGVPFTFTEQEQGFFNFLKQNRKNFNNIKVEAVKYDGKDNYNFDDNYSLTGFISESNSSNGNWYKTPFKDLNKANEFLKALQTMKFRIINIPTSWCKAVTPDLQAARNSAIWEDATLEQLQDEKLLISRLPSMVADFKKDVESLGMVF